VVVDEGHQGGRARGQERARERGREVLALVDLGEGVARGPDEPPPSCAPFDTSWQPAQAWVSARAMVLLGVRLAMPRVVSSVWISWRKALLTPLA
jgi:hypothetical protein